MFAAVCFHVDADASPGLLPRLLQPFARRDLIPDHLYAETIDGSMRVGIRMDAMPQAMVHLVAGNLRQTIGVRNVVAEE
ncbi:MAG: hypothetical protein WCI94_17350 [Rhodospirillales bacterium]